MHQDLLAVAGPVAQRLEQGTHNLTGHIRSDSMSLYALSFSVAYRIHVQAGLSLFIPRVATFSATVPRKHSFPATPCPPLTPPPPARHRSGSGNFSLKRRVCGCRTSRHFHQQSAPRPNCRFPSQKCGFRRHRDGAGVASTTQGEIAKSPYRLCGFARCASH